MTQDEIFELNWITLNCESPFEITRWDDIATWLFAEMILEKLKQYLPDSYLE